MFSRKWRGTLLGCDFADSRGVSSVWSGANLQEAASESNTNHEELTPDVIPYSYWVKNKDEKVSCSADI